MTEFLKSFSSLSLALSLFPIKQIDNIFTPRNQDDQHGPATKAMNAITNAVLDQFGGTLEATFSALDNLQRGAIAVCATTMWPWQGSDGHGHTDGHPHSNRYTHSNGHAHPKDARRTYPDPETRADSSVHNTAAVGRNRVPHAAGEQGRSL